MGELIPTAVPNKGRRNEMESHSTKRKKGCCSCHMNSLGSFGYCIAALGLTAFIIATEVRQLFKYLALPWREGTVPQLELNIFIGLVGASAALVPFFFCAAVLKVGNFANDGFRMGVHDGDCSKDSPPLPLPSGGIFRGAWKHGGPTAPFIHLIISHTLLMARTVMEAATTRAGFLPKESLDMNLGLSSNGGFGPHNETAEGLGIRGDDAWQVGEIPWGPFTPHLLNYLLALLVYAGRYAGVFWGTNKSLGFLFFLQLMFNAAQSVLALNGFQVLYKVRVIGLSERVLPVEGGFLLTFVLSTALYCASQAMVLASGSVIYLYCFVKFEAFLSAEREKYHILSKHGRQTMWAYWPHCWSLAMLVLMTGVASPLIYDWTVIYRSSLDSASLAATIGTVAHIFLWIISWMALTMKSKWHFKLRVQVSKTIVTNTHSIRLVNEIQLSQQAEESEGPIMVIGSGKTYLLQEESSKRALMKLVLTTLTEKKARGEEEEIYWLRPKAPSASGDAAWTKKKTSPGVKHKVTFRDNPNEGPSRPSGGRRIRHIRGVEEVSESEASVESDGDYARLRDVTFPGPIQNPELQVIHEAQNGSSAPSTSRDTDNLSLGSDFPAPPPELTNPAYYPPPPDSPPPPLPNGELMTTKLVMNLKSTAVTSPNRSKAQNPVINVVRGESRESGREVDCQDSSSSSSSSVTPPDKRSDSGVHSQTSTGTSSGTHSKSGSSGSESCVPSPSNAGNGIKVNCVTPPPASSGINRCSSVDELCTMEPSITTQHSSASKCYSLQYGHNHISNYQQNSMPNHEGAYLQQYPLYQHFANCNSNHSIQQNNNDQQDGGGRLNIELVGGGYGFLPPSKFVASEPVYSDASTPVVIRRRSSITAIEPETPPYDRSAASFSTFTEPQLPRSVLRGHLGFHRALSSAVPGKAMTVGVPNYRQRRTVIAESKHATIGAPALVKGFHQPNHIDSRYFSIPAVKQQGNGPLRI